MIGLQKKTQDTFAFLLIGIKKIFLCVSFNKGISAFPVSTMGILYEYA